MRYNIEIYLKKAIPVRKALTPRKDMKLIEALKPIQTIANLYAINKEPTMHFRDVGKNYAKLEVIAVQYDCNGEMEAFKFRTSSLRTGFVEDVKVMEVI